MIAGSRISDHVVESLKNHGKAYLKLRNKLIAEGIIKDDIFIRDYEFSAPSAASAVILGRTSSGNADWRNASGVALRDL